VNPVDGIWVAYYYNEGTGFVPFKTEVQALRFAVGRPGMKVKLAAFGDEDWQTRPDSEPDKPAPIINAHCNAGGTWRPVATPRRIPPPEPFQPSSP
jgi:hypothetical protein